MNKDVTINKIAFCNKCGFLGKLDAISGDHLKPSDNQHCNYLADFFSDSDLNFISIIKNKKEQLESRIKWLSSMVKTHKKIHPQAECHKRYQNNLNDVTAEYNKLRFTFDFVQAIEDRIGDK